MGGDCGRMASERMRRVMEWFGVGEGREQGAGVVAAGMPRVGAGEIVWITGPSGAGKSSLLREMRAQVEREGAARWVDLRGIRLPGRAVVDCLRCPLEEALGRLNAMGLGEAWTYLRRPSELSEGQRWRLRMAMALERVGRKEGRGRLWMLAADEFAAMLDRVTAAVVARAVRRAIDRTPGVCAVLASSQDDLGAALGPDWVVRCDFGRVEVERGRGNRHGGMEARREG